MAHTRASLMSAMALAEETISLNGEALRIREVSLADRLWVDEQADEGGKRNVARMWAALVALGAIGPDGEPLFSRDDIPQIAGWRYTQLRTLGEAILALSEARPGDMKSVDTATDAG